MTHPLDAPIWAALTTCQAPMSQGTGPARRYAAEFAPFAATADMSPASLAGLADLVPPDGAVALFTPERFATPPGLACVQHRDVVQMAAETTADAPGLPGRALSTADLSAIMALVALTKPGPFAARTIELGRYHGIFDGDELIAMAGERMRLPGFVEISAVCTHPDHQRRGLSRTLIAALSHAAMARGETPFLHVFADNASAIALYRRMGFVERRIFQLTVLRRAAPAIPAAPDTPPPSLRSPR